MMRMSSFHDVKWCKLALPVLLATTGAFAQVAAKRYPITTEMVVSAMQYRQLPVEGVQIRLSAPITASSASPMLDIQSMTMTDAHHAQMRIACRAHGECLPFYVAAKWPDASATVTVPEGLARKQVQASAPVKLNETPAEGKLRPGSPATLMIEDKKVHIRLQVVCLEGGVTGDKVRVSTPDHKLSYNAEIIAPNLLKGSF